MHGEIQLLLSPPGCREEGDPPAKMPGDAKTATRRDHPSGRQPDYEKQSSAVRRMEIVTIPKSIFKINYHR
jgi:hypothetical protein